MKKHEFQKVGNAVSSFHDNYVTLNDGGPGAIITGKDEATVLEKTLRERRKPKTTTNTKAGVQESDHLNKRKDIKRTDEDLSKVLSIKAEKIRHKIIEEMKKDYSALDTELVEDESNSSLKFVESSNRSHNPATLPETSGIAVVDHASHIPVSLARIKRREKQKKELDFSVQTKDQQQKPKASSTRSTVDIRKYRPAYTWNKGGRVKELRIRCLARKFLYLWQRNTFGRVPLSLALQHCEDALKRKTFAAWYEYWWEIVKEWRLGVRAECHIRHKLCLHAFVAWRQFVHLKRIKNAKSQNADQKFHQMLLGKTWHCWLRYVKMKHAQLPLKTEADKFREANLIRCAWAEWRRRHFILESQKESFTLAVQFSSYRLQAQHWLLWKNAFHIRLQIEEQYKNASIYHNSILVIKCLRVWKMYNQNRQIKKSHYAFANRKYTAHLKGKCLLHWHQRWHLIQSLQQHQNQMESLAKTFRMRWAMWRWKLYVDSCNVQKHEELLAQQHYDLYLMRLGFDSFRLNIVHCQIKVMRNQLSTQLAASQLTRRTWNRWIEVLDEREKMRMASSTLAAQEHYRMNLVLKCFMSLADYAKWRKLRKIQYAKAEAHFFLHAIPKCLFHFKLNVELERTCRQNAIESQNFYRSITLRKSFGNWHARSIKQRDDRMMHRMAVLHNESLSRKNAFALWRERTMEKERERENMWQAERHYMYSLFQKSFDAWLCYVEACKNRVLNERKSIVHHYCTLTKKSLVQWRKWIQYKAQMKMKAQTADNHYSKKSLACCMNKWKKVRQQGQTFRSIANERYVEHQKNLLRTSLREWKIVTSNLAAKKRKEMVARIYYNKILISKTMLEWHRYAAVRAYKHAQTQELLSNAFSQLQKLKLALFWKRWIEEKNKAKGVEIQCEEADHHYQHSVSRKIFHCWKTYARCCLRKKLLSRQSQWFHNVRLGAKYFLTWQERLRDRGEENEKSQLALWHWSLSLQRKMLITWISYKDHQKHKKQRLIEALLYRREHLLRSACCQWLTTADSLYQVRSSMAARHQTKAVMDSFLLVQRCAFHWRSWARRRKVARGADVKTKLMPFTPVPIVAKARTEFKPSEASIVSSVLPSQAMIKSTMTTRDDFKPSLSAVSPLRPGTGFLIDASNSLRLNPRPLPTRPAFLIDSLQRAGLYSQMFSEALADHPPDIEESDGNSSLVGDPRVLESPDRPSTGRFEFRDMPPSQRSKSSVKNVEARADSSLSADVFSGSNSTLGPSNSAWKPLHLSNTDTDLGSTQTTSSHSPLMFTPSTQRSQFSGNPLLYSSPVSDSGAAKPPSAGADCRNLSLGDQAIDGWVVRGNLDRGDKDEFLNYDLSSKQPPQNQTSQPQDMKIEKRSVVKDNRFIDDTFVIYKPEDFIKKPPVHEKSRRHSSEESLGTLVKHTPRAFATWELDKLSEYAEQEGQGIVKGSDSAREGKGVLRHTPREVFSPRRVAPQGILHNKVSDSDADVSPLNTARSRGTVTFASPTSPTPEEEIMNIRDRLKHFAQQKRKLRSLQKQYRQLSDWVLAQGDKQSDDDDSRNATEELDMIRLEVAQLQAFVDGHKPICERLVLRAQSLVAELNISNE